MEQYGQHGVLVSELVERQMEIAEADGRKVDYDTAFEEVIASSMETMLSSGNVVEAVAKLKAKDPTLWERFAEYFRNLAERIRKAFRGLSPTSREGRYVVTMKDAAERLEALFTDALVTASGREQSKNTAEGGVKYSYRNADQKVIDFVDSVRSMKDKSRISKRKLRIGAISKSHAHMISNIIKQATGNDIDLSGYEIWIDGNAIQHIDNRHGVNGDADQTMSDVRDIGMILWVVNHADGGDIARDVDGSLDYSEVFYNSDGTAAPIVLLHKYIDNHLFVVAECVPDSRSKRLQIVSAYKKSSSEGQVLNMESEDSPQPTSEVPHDGNATTAISIPHESDSVKRKFSTNAVVGDDLYTQLQEMRIRERDAAERLDRAIQEMQNDPKYLEAAEALMDAKGLSARREARRRIQAIEEQ